MCWSQKKYSRSRLKREGGVRLLKGRLDDDKMTSDRPLTPDLTQRESQPCDFSEFLPSCPGGAGTALGGLDGKGGSSAVTEKRPVSQPHDSRHTVAALDCARGKPLLSPEDPPRAPTPTPNHSGASPESARPLPPQCCPALLPSSAHWPATPTPRTTAKAQG